MSDEDAIIKFSRVENLKKTIHHHNKFVLLVSPFIQQYLYLFFFLDSKVDIDFCIKKVIGNLKIDSSLHTPSR